MAERASAFGAHVIGIRRTPAGTEPVHEMHPPEELFTLLPRADVVVLTLPATDDTLHLVNDDFLAAMRPDAVLVNVARGSIVDEDALLRALDGERLDFAVLDVVGDRAAPAREPAVGPPRDRGDTAHVVGGRRPVRPRRRPLR